MGRERGGGEGKRKWEARRGEREIGYREEKEFFNILSEYVFGRFVFLDLNFYEMNKYIYGFLGNSFK